MKEPLKSVSEVIAQANDKFYEVNNNIDTLVGIIDKALRKQGMNADAVTIDCPALDKKLVFLLHDSKADSVDIAQGNKAGDIFSSASEPLAELTVNKVVAIMNSYFKPL
ncbi:hypothetical protein [Thalassotalea agariperforans]